MFFNRRKPKTKTKTTTGPPVVMCRQKELTPDDMEQLRFIRLNAIRWHELLEAQAEAARAILGVSDDGTDDYAFDVVNELVYDTGSSKDVSETISRIHTLATDYVA